MLVIKFLLIFFFFLLLNLECSANPSSDLDSLDSCDAAPIRKNGCKVASERVIEEAKSLKKFASKKRRRSSSDTPCVDLPSFDSIIELSGISNWPSELIYNQGKLNSCTANALAFCIRYLSIRNSSDPKSFVDNPELLSPSRLYLYYNTRYLEGLIDKEDIIEKDTGASIAASVLALIRYGCCPETFSDELQCALGSLEYGGWEYRKKLFPVQPTPENYHFALGHNSGLKCEEAALQDAAPNPYKSIPKNIRCVDLCSKYKKKSKRSLTIKQKNSLIKEFKAVLSRDVPIFYGLTHDKNLDNDDHGFVQTPDMKTFLPAEDELSTAEVHAIVLVGYGKYNPSKPRKNYFKFINSWGACWGHKGFGYLEEKYITNQHLFSLGGYSIDLAKGEI
ncbi:MAG: C1 family peptidase [Proteobacteria bacterium]|nr:C1 family peptidase [Pseudomonadota bacterium]